MWLSNKSIPEKILMYWQALDSVRCEKVHCTPNCSQHVEGEINKVCETLQCNVTKKFKMYAKVPKFKK